MLKPAVSFPCCKRKNAIQIEKWLTDIWSNVIYITKKKNIQILNLA
jgi:hypothetical protein